MTRITLRRAVSNALLANGYKRSGRTHIRPITDDFSVIVDTGPLDGFGDIAPWVGLRCDAAEHLRAELMERPNDRYAATVGDNAGVVLGQGYRAWSGAKSLDEVVRAISEATGVMLEFASLERLSEVTEFPWGKSTRVFDMVPLYLLIDDRDRAEEWLERGQGSECWQVGPVCDQFRRFERNVRARLMATSTT